MRNKNILFTTNYGVAYDNWIKQEVSDNTGGFFTKYMRGTDSIYVSTAVFYLLVKIEDKLGKQLCFKYIRTIPEYLAIKKQLKWT